MRTALALALVIACTVAVVMAGGGGGDEPNVDETDVIVLTNDNFDDITKSEELMLVEFYAPWCGHCKHLKPEFAKAATDLKPLGVRLGKVDATIESSIAQRYKVNGYPKLFVMRNGRESDYNGPREQKGIVDYMKKQVGPAAKPLSSEAEFKSFTKLDSERDFVVVGFFDKANVKTSQLHSSFLLVSSRMRDDFFFGIVTDPALAKSVAGIDLSAPEYKEGAGALIAFKTYDDKKTPYTGTSKTSNVQDWITQQSLPVVGEFSKATAQRYAKRGLPVAKYFTKIARTESNAKQLTYVMNRLTPIATEFAGKILVATASATEFAQSMEEYGWKGKESGFVIESSNGKAKYRFEQSFKAENLKKFVSDFLADKLTLWIKSEEPPVVNDGPVKIVTGKTFNDIVSDVDKDVLIEFYAPWCGHCKTLAPKYDKLGTKFKSVDSVVIAKIDATANDYPPIYEVKGFPTIFFKPAGKNSKPMLYEGDRETDKFVSFIKKHSKTKWSFKKK